jgi:hypothetical protein
MTEPPALPNRSRLFSEPLLVVRRKPEIVDWTPLYAITDQHGARVGSVADVGQRDARASMQPDRLAARIERARGEGRGLKATIKMMREVAAGRLEVRDEAGAAVLVLTTAGPWMETPLFTVARRDGVAIGTITEQASRLRHPGSESAPS